MKTYKEALIGCGYVSKKHIDAAARMFPMCVLTAVCDKDPDRTNEAVAHYCSVLKQSFPDLNESRIKIREYNDYRQMLQDDVCDIAAVTVPTGYHGVIAMECLNAGMHVIVEKPPTLSLMEMDMLIECADRKGLKLGVCFQNRFSGTVRKLRRAVEADMFGRLVHAVSSTRWNRSSEYYQQASWRGKWGLDGGALMNQCIHNIDLLQWVMGSAETVYSMTDTYLRPIEAEDFGAVLIRFRNGSVGIVEGTTCIYRKNLEQTLNIFGEKGTVCLGGLSINNIRVWEFEKEVPISDTSPEGSEYIQLYLDFIDSIENNRTPLVDGREARKSLEIVLAAYMSSKEGMPVRMPLKEFSTINMYS